MTWQEQIKSICEIHALSRIHASEQGDKWEQVQTGALLGVSQTQVSFALAVHAKIVAGDKEIAECASLRDALTLLSKRKQTAAEAALAQRQSSAQLVSAPSQHGITGQSRPSWDGGNHAS